MMANHLEKIGSMEQDHLVIAGGMPILTGARTIKSGQGKLKRGTALALNANDGKLIVLGSATGDGITANAILCDDTDASSVDALAEVYISGSFNANALHVASDYELSAADKEKFRLASIYLENSMKYGG